MYKLITFSILLQLTRLMFAGQFFVTPDGLPTGDGSMLHPWDIQTAFNQPSSVFPNDTIWLREGTYSGNFISNLIGEPDAFIHVIQFPLERAVIQDNRQFASGATLQVNGSWCIYKNFEIANINPNRNSIGADSFRPMGLQIEADHTKFINLVIHDTGHGIGFWADAVDAEIYGCVIYNCGTSNSPGEYSTHGHGIYSQNNVGYKTIKNNIIFNQFGFGLHLYPNPGNVINYFIEGNTLFNNGILTNDTIRYSNILLQTYTPYQIDNIQITDNLTYDSKSFYTYTSIYEADLLLGAFDVNSKNLVVENNYFSGKGRPGLAILNWDTVQYNFNTSYYDPNGTIGLVIPDGIDNSDYNWNYNNYYGGENTQQFSYQYAPSINFEAWKALTGYDSGSNFFENKPDENYIVIQPNDYETGRANLLVYNWLNLSDITLNLSSTGLIEGQTFKIVDVQNFFGEPLYTGTYTGDNPTVTISTKGLSTMAPVGLGAIPNTASEFLTLIIIPTSHLNALNQITPSVSKLNCYPNPANNQINITYCTAKPRNILYEIYSLEGNLLYSENNAVTAGSHTHTVQLPNAHPGLYIVKLNVDNTIHSQTIIIQ